MKGIFLETQGPENLQNRSQREQRPGFGIAPPAARQPMSEVGEGMAQEGSGRLGDVQAMGPAAERGGIGDVIRVFECGCRLFPGVVLLKAPPQCATSSEQAVVRVRERKQWQEGEGLPAAGATTATDLDPIVMFIMRLLAAASMADNRIAFAPGTSPQDDLLAAFGPIRFEPVRRSRKWDKENRSSLGLYPGIDLPRFQPEAEPLLLKRKCQLKENNAARPRISVVRVRGLAG